MMNPEKQGYDQGAPPAYPQAQPQVGYGQQPQTVVVTQPTTTTTVVSGPAPPNYLIGSILACLFCFWPTGICAIYYALQVNNAVGQGNIPEAEENSKKARIFMIVTISVGAVWILIVIIAQIAAASAASAAHKRT